MGTFDPGAPSSGRKSTMPVTIRHSIAHLSVVVVIALFVNGCSENAPSDNSRPTPATATTTAGATSAAADPMTGPMTGDELVWLEGISALHTTMDRVMVDAPSTVTSAKMRTLTVPYAGCTRALDRLGPPTDRLRPVYELAKQACAEYEKAATCFATAAKLGVIEGSAEAKKQSDAMDCGFAAPGKGSGLFADAESMGFELKDATR
jgi:hypothetical protein